MLDAPSEDYSTQDILQAYGNDCHICGLEIDLNAPRRPGLKGWENGLQLDRVIPLAMGGSNLVSNVKPSHGRCNLTKAKYVSN